MLAECAACGTLYAPDLDRCPHCGSEERADGMPKITSAGASFPEDHAQDGAEPDAGAPEAPEATEPSPEPPAAPEAAPAPSAPARPVPPRRQPPPVTPGG